MSARGMCVVIWLIMVIAVVLAFYQNRVGAGVAIAFGLIAVMMSLDSTIIGS